MANITYFYQLELQTCKIKAALEKAWGSSIVKLTPTNRYAIARVAQPNNLKSSLKVSCMNYDNNANTHSLSFRVAHYGPKHQNLFKNPFLIQCVTD